MAHSDTVIYADGVELKRHSTRGSYCFFDKFAKCLQVHMSGHYVNIRIAHGNKWFMKIMFSYHTRCAQQSAMWRPFKAYLYLIRTHIINSLFVDGCNPIFIFFILSPAG